MSVPPFPSQDLAKLVLGYLAEEQLMTAYDEFLQASPYLDALQNEYDRIFMNSLRNILSEYRAVKIYVETCKPLILRKKLVHCANLLEIIKYLVDHVDINKLHCQELSERPSYVSGTRFTKTVACESCSSAEFSKCICKSKNGLENTKNQSSKALTSTVESSVETTSLSDLPGHLTNNGGLANEGKISSQKTNVINNQSVQQPLYVTNTSTHSNTIQNVVLTVRTNEPFPLITGHLNHTSRQNHVVPGAEDKYVLSTAGSFQDFATGIKGPDSGNTNVPDSSTSESFQVSTTKESAQQGKAGKAKIIIREKNTPYLFKVDNANNFVSQQNESRNPAAIKSEEQKITILSDVKVEQALNNYEGVKQIRMPQILKNATSTPVMQMQTILINGIPAYRQVPMLPMPGENYTKDEIMAMPTIIVAPTSKSSIPSSTSQSEMQAKTLKQCMPPKENSLVPLVIDVQPNSPLSSRIQPDKPVTDKENVSQIESGLIKTVDIKHKNPSVPKDSIVTSPGKVNTPHVLPPLRKSSSTPRRSSHIRVLDFATPRRILHETIMENVQEINGGQVEVVLSRSPNLANANLGPVEGNVTLTIPPEEASSSKLIEEAKKINPIALKKRNWDADLRALAVMSPSGSAPVTKPKPKKEKKPRKSKIEGTKSKKKPTKDKATQKSSQVVEIIDIDDGVKVIENNTNGNTTVKPTINIIAGIDKNASGQESAKKDKSNEEKRDKSTEDCVETPETERLSLQNVIGAKLNISEFLETPYKQAFYDIQMETPRFLGPDIPGEPLSDIKIMSIPTPRFLASPNVAQATPSSYSSRPTDYSSSGSYYKPDDQEYIPSAEILDCITTSNKRDSDTVKQPNKEPGKSRPVRQCTKNVSYCGRGKKDTDDAETNSTSSETVNNRKSSTDSKQSKEASKLTRDANSKSENNKSKKKISAKKRKTPEKKEVSKSFMKIKPRKCSPIKTPKIKKKCSPLKSAKRKKLSNIEKSVSVIPPVDNIPTKSRRKSSTPRKLHCTKTFHSESSGHESPDLEMNSKVSTSGAGSGSVGLDSDTDQLNLRWSDDGSQDVKSKDLVDNAATDAENIAKITEYIAKSSINPLEVEGNLHLDLINRGFDAETAKKIERDLLGRSPEPKPSTSDSTIKQSFDIYIDEEQQDKSSIEKNITSDTSNSLQIVQDEDEDVEDVEWSVMECNEENESQNYIKIMHDDSKEPCFKEPAKLKEKYSMEVSIEDGVTVRCRATDFRMLFEKNHKHEINFRETHLAVSSISTNFSTLYTPLKDAVRAKCHEIFDSTLTSIDTPLKTNSPKRKEDERTVIDIVLEEENVGEIEKEVKERAESKKRKRQSVTNSDESSKECKKAKPETQYLLNSANIQNIDIESVLKQLHGS